MRSELLMGYEIEFNWILKIDTAEDLSQELLKAGSVLDFHKSGRRIYPIGIPIELVNEKWDVIAEVVILETTIGHDKTNGRFKVLKIPKQQCKSLYFSYKRQKLF